MREQSPCEPHLGIGTQCRDPQKERLKGGLYLFSLVAIISYQKLSSLKQHPFIISEFCNSQLLASSDEPSVNDLKRSKLRCHLIWALIWRLSGDSASRHNLNIGRIEFNEVIWLRSSFLGWLSAGGHPHLPEATFLTFLHLQSQQWFFKSLWLPFWSPLLLYILRTILLR